MERFGSMVPFRISQKKSSLNYQNFLGPTVYSALCFRDVVREVHMADYVEGNLKLLREWLNKESQHDWKPTIRVIRR